MTRNALKARKSREVHSLIEYGQAGAKLLLTRSDSSRRRYRPYVLIRYPLRSVGSAIPRRSADRAAPAPDCSRKIRPRIRTHRRGCGNGCTWRHRSVRRGESQKLCWQVIMVTRLSRSVACIGVATQGWLSAILCWFHSGIPNGINSLVQTAKAKAQGYRSHRHLKAIIYLIAGKLDLRLPT